MARPKLFRKKDPEALRSKRVPILFTQEEHEQVAQSAALRILDVSEFIRRAALNRRADVRVETLTVLHLSQVVADLRRLHKALEEANDGVDPIAQEILQAIRLNRDALARLREFHH